MSSEINDSDIQLLLILLNQDGWDWYHNVCTALVAERDALRKERDEAWLLKGRIFNEIDCRIEHGADSNGHLEAIRNLFRKTE